MSFRCRAVSGLAAFVLSSSLAAAQAAPSPDDQEACTPDVFKLCSAAIPGEDAIVACLNAKVTQLSPACRAVIDPPKVPPHKRRARHA